MSILSMNQFPSLDGKSENFKVPKVTTKAIEIDLSEDDSSSSRYDTNSVTSASDSEQDDSQKPVDTLKSASPESVDTTPIVKPEETAEPVEDSQVAYDGRRPPVPRSIAQISEDIVGVLARYRLIHQNDTSKTWGAKAKFIDQIEKFVAKGEPVAMSLPAFPFKSPNKLTKVLGTLPDKGEEVALSHLNGLCLAVKDVYEQGANVYIVSDGLMYSDILGISDLEVWRYGQALRKMARDYKLDHVKFLRLRNLLGGGGSVEPITEEEYLKHAPEFRTEIITKYLPENFDPDLYITKDADTTLTYRGYIKFLETDLANHNWGEETKTKAQIKKLHEEVAKKMIVRGKVKRSSDIVIPLDHADN